MNKYTPLLGIVLLVILSGCSTFSRPEKIITEEVLVEKIPLNLESPASMKWKHVDFIVITPENYEEKLEELKKNGGSKALYAVNTQDYQKLSKVTVGYVFCSFALNMTIFRFYGDFIIEKFGLKTTIKLSICSSLFGMLVYAQNSTSVVSIISAGLVGAGIANIYPITMTLAASLSGSKERNVATVAFISFSSFLIGAPLIGVMGEYLGLKIAFSIIAPTSLFPILYLFYSNKNFSSKDRNNSSC